MLLYRCTSLFLKGYFLIFLIKSKYNPDDLMAHANRLPNIVLETTCHHITYTINTVYTDVNSYLHTMNLMLMRKYCTDCDKTFLTLILNAKQCFQPGCDILQFIYSKSLCIDGIQFILNIKGF